MTQFTLSQNTQNLINTAVSSGPGTNNINYWHQQGHSMNNVTLLSFLTLLLPILGCTGVTPEDNQRFRSEIAENLSINMPLTVAKERLTQLGFSCDEQSSAPNITCTRTKQNILPYSCIQRVNLSPDPERDSVAAVTPEPIVCAGL
jgi:hypothetical protein